MGMIRRNPFDERVGTFAMMSARWAYRRSPFSSFAPGMATIDHLDGVVSEVAKMACLKASKEPTGRILNIAVRWSKALINSDVFVAPGGDLGKVEIDRRKSLYRDPKGLAVWSDTHAGIIAEILSDLPNWLDDGVDPGGINLEIEILGVMKSPKKALDNLQWRILEAGPSCINGLHGAVAAKVDSVTEKRSRSTDDFDEDGAAITIGKHPSNDLHHLIDGYFQGTGITAACRQTVPIVMNDTTRSRHTWVVGGSGSGKSYTIARQIVNRLERVARGEAAMLLIDPKCQLIDFLMTLGCFKPGGELAKRTWLFDLGDPDLTPRLTPWSLAGNDADFNQALDAFTYLVGEVGDASVSQRQKTVISHFLKLMTVWPGATLDTLREVLQQPELANPYLHLLDRRSLEFFKSVNDGGLDYVADVTNALYWRVDGLQSFDEFNLLLNNAEATFDAADELNKGALVMIRLPQFKLSAAQQGDLGRALLAMTSGVINQRYAAGNLDHAIPGDVIIDECHMVFQGAEDSIANRVLSTARGARWGLTLMHQDLGQLAPAMKSSIMTNCGTLLIGKCSEPDAKVFAANMGCSKSLFPNIKDDGARHFVIKSDGMIDRGTICHAPHDEFDDVGRLSGEEHAALMDGFRKRFTELHKASKQRSSTKPPTNVVELDSARIKQQAVPL